MDEIQSMQYNFFSEVTMQKESASQKVAQPYSNKGLLEYMVKWLVACDIRLEVVESAEFASLIHCLRHDAIVPTLKAVERHIFAQFKENKCEVCGLKSTPAFLSPLKYGLQIPMILDSWPSLVIGLIVN